MSTTIRNPRDLAALQDEVLTRLARQRLTAFIELAWPILEPGTAFRSSWHIGLIAEYLEAVTSGQIRQLVINMPPRYGKSLITSVMWPVWEWIAHPSRRWLFVSHSDTLARRHGLDRRRLLLDDWFRQRFRHVRLSRDQHEKAEFHNTSRGTMIATSMGGSITGKGGDRLVIDDPHSPEQVESDLQRQHAIDRFRMTLATRLDDKRHGAMVVVMQRLHTQDLSGFCLDLGFEHLCLPALAPTRTTVHFPMSGQNVVREADEPLWPGREDRAALDAIRQTLGSYAFAGQYQQTPVPRTGGLFPRDGWAYFDDLDWTDAQIIQSWDLSFKDGTGSDYVVGFVAARIGALVYILDRYKQRASFTETCRAIRAMTARYPRTSTVLIEAAANGPAVIDTLKAEVEGITGVLPQGGKFARAHAAQPKIAAKQVLLPNPTAGGVLRPERLWVEDLVAVCAAFPKGAFDDDVDALTQLLVWCQQHPVVRPACFCIEPEPSFVPKFGVTRDSFEPRPVVPGELWRRAQQFALLNSD